MTRTRARVATVGLAGVGGVVAAHTIGFMIAIPDARARAEELARTGHDYWSIAVAVAVIASSAAVVAAFGTGRRAPRRASSPRARLGQWAALGIWQIGAFAAMEVAERIQVGEPLNALLDERAFRVGVVLQLVVAALAVLVLALAESAGAASVRRGATSRAASTFAARRIPSLVAALGPLAGEPGDARAPPVLAVS